MASRPGLTSGITEVAQTKSDRALATWKEQAKQNINPAFARHPKKKDEVVNAIEKVEWDHQRMAVEDVTTQNLYNDAMESLFCERMPSVQGFVDVCPPSPSVLEALRIMNGLVLPPDISALLQEYGLDPDACCNPDLDDERKVLLEDFEIKYVGDDRFGPLDLRISKRRRDGGDVKEPAPKKRKRVPRLMQKSFSFAPQIPSPPSKIDWLSTSPVWQNNDEGSAPLKLRETDSQTQDSSATPQPEHQDGGLAVECLNSLNDRTRKHPPDTALITNKLSLSAIPADVNHALDAISAKMMDMRAAIAAQQQGQNDSIRNALRPLHQALDTIHKSTKATMEAAEMIKATLEKLDRDLTLEDGLVEGRLAVQG
ncbi:uncharacterized protein ColSpa_06238 [Colletotrichum spaethianum]|uniref:Uncharacterized protein n=1 Tax=Colletotrichum spaethianum TaxID=700344 RepID=A0AA37NYB2_9PEZI|nr:uncharacterized protein ColSpa_06238 [Colletotrichum spaethianum]GKT46057.1 hypothetical protein ColSpa_06238 [Colletotrichum spaethianum]